MLSKSITNHSYCTLYSISVTTFVCLLFFELILSSYCSGFVLTVCVCLFTSHCCVCTLGWVKCRAHILSIGHNIWPHVTSCPFLFFLFLFFTEQNALVIESIIKQPTTVLIAHMNQFINGKCNICNYFNIYTLTIHWKSLFQRQDLK